MRVTGLPAGGASMKICSGAEWPGASATSGVAAAAHARVQRAAMLSTRSAVFQGPQWSPYLVLTSDGTAPQVLPGTHHTCTEYRAPRFATAISSSANRPASFPASIAT